MPSSDWLNTRSQKQSQSSVSVDRLDLQTAYCNCILSLFSFYADLFFFSFHSAAVNILPLHESKQANRHTVSILVTQCDGSLGKKSKDAKSWYTPYDSFLLLCYYSVRSIYPLLSGKWASTKGSSFKAPRTCWRKPQWRWQAIGHKKRRKKKPCNTWQISLLY